MPKPSQIIRKKFPFTPTQGQEKLFLLFDQFLTNTNQKRLTLILKGYAGTGKTTVISALVKALPHFDFRSVLLAPTGRAAKVMANYAERSAFTIHKIIYQRTADPHSGKIQFKRRRNYYKQTLFIIDEASMLSDEAGMTGNGLLSDLIDFVFEDDSNKMMLIGDAAQLPPVGQLLSRGLDASYLSSFFRLSILETELTEVMRQDLESGILYNATAIREEVGKENFNILFQTRKFKDVYRMSGDRLEDGLRYAYDKFGKENTIIVCRSNRETVQYNEYIRRSIFFFDQEIEAGDYLMIVKNNYYFLGEDSPAGFLANGDFVEILRVVDLEEMYGLRFATLELQLLDYPDQVPFEAKVILDTLHSPTPALPEEDHNKLYQQVFADYQDAGTKQEQLEAVRSDMYLNALQVKFAYALTCHKSQGGQWDAVFVSQGYLAEDMINQEYLRWLYTAVTRAKGELYLMNFKAEFFE
ncbi:ATP-dependent DNA helicase [Catalinimonas niigatensis]|uniref:ATP-dependent DNA helicase n=1 Tax=Catalinimonas niigatensis TaxID=1397264 RepID=UPI002665817A|nr:AAA family ATPase [Catalinimonas niigatensis]WPP51622.1 AAA family ATPase [Catalinimonas niigatensis]